MTHQHQMDGQALEAGGLWEEGLLLEAQAHGLLGLLVAAEFSGQQVTCTCSRELDAAELVVLQDTINAHASSAAVDSHRQSRIEEVDARTQELIDLGFEYPPSSGKIFGLGDAERLDWLGIKVCRDDIPYPFPVTPMDGSGQHLLGDAAELDLFILAALGGYVASVTSGGQLKESLNAALTHDAISAVVDNR